MQLHLNLKLASLGLFILIASTSLLAQSTEGATQAKRTYAPKNTAEKPTIPSQKPTRTYANKNSVESTSSTTSVKPTRTYAKKPENKNANPTPELKKQVLPESSKTTTTNRTETIKPTVEKQAKTSFWSSLFGGKSKKSSNTSQKTNEIYKGHSVYIGPKGGKYYLNKNGNKTYIK